MGVAWGGAFKTLRGPDGRAESVQGWIYSVSQKALPQARPWLAARLQGGCNKLKVDFGFPLPWLP